MSVENRFDWTKWREEPGHWKEKLTIEDIWIEEDRWMNLAKFTTDRGLAAVTNRGSPFDLLGGNQQETSPSASPRVASRPTPKTENPASENRVRGAQLTNRRVYQAQRILTTVTEAMGQLEELLPQIEWTKQDSPVEDETASVVAENLTAENLASVVDQLIQAQQGVDQLQDQFEETTSGCWMAHLPRSKTEEPANFPLIREMDLAEQTQKRIRQQIADDSSLAVQAQADHISTQIGLLLS